MTEEECRQQLGSTAVGRMALTRGGLPVIVPVRYRLEGDQLLFQVARGSSAERATRHALVAFEVDHLDARGEWTVCVTGFTREQPDEQVHGPRDGHGGGRVTVALSLDQLRGRRAVEVDQPLLGSRGTPDGLPLDLAIVDPVANEWADGRRMSTISW